MRMVRHPSTVRASVTHYRDLDAIVTVSSARHHHRQRSHGIGSTSNTSHQALNCRTLKFRHGT
jgi:hypothetical protein